MSVLIQKLLYHRLGAIQAHVVSDKVHKFQGTNTIFEAFTHSLDVHDFNLITVSKTVKFHRLLNVLLKFLYFVLSLICRFAKVIKVLVGITSFSLKV